MKAFEPDDEAVAAVALKLAGSGWRFGIHVTLKDGGLYQQQSRFDRRVTVTHFVPRRGQETWAYVFRDPGVDVEVSPGGPIILDDGREFSTLDDLARAMLIHDRALAEAREWERAAPQAGRAA